MTQTAAALARFAAEAFAALQQRERDPIEDAERAAHFSAPAEQTNKKEGKHDRDAR